ncbi:septum formation initiator family protein [Facilibium subflavum]|uniref:septum formation initiator family protein n=1 Tax=Facilibium subflavum TaxID=2219058 RepID=UPI000E64E8F4|nr:septum formation initiator family protein [Facilibium subflavum]
MINRYFIFIGVLIVLIGALQYDLWWSRSGLFAVRALSSKVTNQARQNEKLQFRNNKMYDEILSLRHSDEVLEGLARKNLGLIKEGELFYQFVPKNNKAKIDLKEDHA